MKYTKRDIRILKVYSGRSPYNWEYGWVIDDRFYSPSPALSEGDAMQQAMDWIEKYNDRYDRYK